MSTPRKYRQLKDSPTHPAGTVWELNERMNVFTAATKYRSGYSFHMYREDIEQNPGWFEEIKDDEWPKDGGQYWILDSRNQPQIDVWNGLKIDFDRLETLQAYRTREEAEHEKARRKSLREAKVQSDERLDTDSECVVILTMPKTYATAWRALADRNPTTK